MMYGNTNSIGQYGRIPGLNAMHCAAYVRMPSYSIYIYTFMPGEIYHMLYCTFCKKVQHNLYRDYQYTLMVVMICANTQMLIVECSIYS